MSHDTCQSFVQNLKLDFEINHNKCRHVLLNLLKHLGKHNFTLICLKQGVFFLNEKSVTCQKGSSIVLPEREWELKNDYGSFVHFEYHHLLRNRSLTGSNWDDLSDILTVPRFEEPNVTVTPEIENGYFTFVDGEGILTNQSHFFGYSAICIFFI